MQEKDFCKKMQKSFLKSFKTLNKVTVQSRICSLLVQKTKYSLNSNINCIKNLKKVANGFGQKYNKA